MGWRGTGWALAGLLLVALGGECGRAGERLRNEGLLTILFAVGWSLPLGGGLGVPMHGVRCDLRNDRVRSWVMEDLVPPLEEHRARTGAYPARLTEWRSC